MLTKVKKTRVKQVSKFCHTGRHVKAQRLQMLYMIASKFEETKITFLFYLHVDG